MPSGEKRTANPGANEGGRASTERLREAPGRGSSRRAAGLGLGAVHPRVPSRGIPGVRASGTALGGSAPADSHLMSLGELKGKKVGT